MSNTTGATIGTGTDYAFEAPEFTHSFKWGSCCIFLCSVLQTIVCLLVLFLCFFYLYFIYSFWLQFWYHQTFLYKEIGGLHTATGKHYSCWGL